MTSYVIYPRPDAERILRVDAMDGEGRGIARVEGKATFVEGGLPGETVAVHYLRRKPTYDIARVGRVLLASSQRTEPGCPHFGVCGGCSMQHLAPVAQVAVKQRVLEDNLWHIGRLRPDCVLPAIHGPTWNYRHRARFSVRYVMKKGGVLVGFHERASSFIAEMGVCPVQTAEVSALIVPLRALVNRLSIRDRLPQVEVARGENTIVLVFRVLEALTDDDRALLAAFGDTHGVQIWLQPKGPDSAAPFHPGNGVEPCYTLPEFGITMPFRPTDFTQVNFAVNRMLVRRAVGLLDPRPGERVADLFCGLGNFSLPLARCGARVTGVEGSTALVRRARANAAANGLAERCHFEDADLFTVDAGQVAAWGPFDKMLIDPPRDGAVELIKAIPDSLLPRRIVYVSCSPATLARDAAVLVHTRGYRLRAAGIANMFPHTAHVESISLFERENA